MIEVKSFKINRKIRNTKVKLMRLCRRKLGKREKEADFQSSEAFIVIVTLRQSTIDQATDNGTYRLHYFGNHYVLSEIARKFCEK